MHVPIPSPTPSIILRQCTRDRWKPGLHPFPPNRRHGSIHLQASGASVSPDAGRSRKMGFVGKAWRLLVGIKDGLVLIFMMVFFGLLYAALSASPYKDSAREGALRLDLGGAIVEQPAARDPLAALGGSPVDPRISRRRAGPRARHRRLRRPDPRRRARSRHLRRRRPDRDRRRRRGARPGAARGQARRRLCHRL